MRCWKVLLVFISFMFTNISPCFANDDEKKAELTAQEESSLALIDGAESQAPPVISPLALAISEATAVDDQIEKLRKEALSHLRALNALKPDQLKAVLLPVFAVWKDVLRLSLATASEASDGGPYRSNEVNLLALHSKEQIQQALELLNAIELAAVKLDEGSKSLRSHSRIHLGISPLTVGGVLVAVAAGGPEGVGVGGMIAAVVGAFGHLMNLSLRLSSSYDAYSNIKESLSLLRAIDEMWREAMLELEKGIPNFQSSEYRLISGKGRRTTFLGEHATEIARAIVNYAPKGSLLSNGSTCTLLLLDGTAQAPRLALPPGQSEEKNDPSWKNVPPMPLPGPGRD